MDPSNKSKRAKRSTTDLSSLRLAPLSSRYSSSPPPQRRQDGMTSPRSSTHNDNTFLDAGSGFTRSHSSYLQGKSAPTTPGILSRSSSRRHLGGGGFSRRGSLYDNDHLTMSLADVEVPYEYAGVVRDEAGGVRVDVDRSGSLSGNVARLPKAKSEAALLVQRSKKGSMSKGQGQSLLCSESRTSVRGGSTTPTPRVVAFRTNRQSVAVPEDDWLTRTGLAATAMLQESKGQSWLSSAHSSSTHLQDTTDEEDADDEGYEEMAAAISSQPRSPVSARQSRWGSRYGSRVGSRRPSRRGSVGSQTPLPSHLQLSSLTQMDKDVTNSASRDDISVSVNQIPGLQLVDASEEEGESQDEASIEARLTSNRSFGLGGVVDRLMNFRLFQVREESAAEDSGTEEGETERQANERRERENARRKDEKERVAAVRLKDAREGGDEEEGSRWSDAAWLIGVAQKAAFDG